LTKGSGFLVGKEILATNYHLLSQAKSAQGINYKGKKVKFEGFISVDKNMDLALVKVKSKETPMPLGSAEGLSFGKALVALGSDESGGLKAIGGKITQVAEFDPSRKVIDTTIEAPNTFSGGPVVDSEGQVIGILTFLDIRKHFVIPVDFLKSLSKTGSVIKFKKQTPVDYLETLEGINIAGKVFAALKNTGRAEKYLKKLVEQKPDDMKAQLLLADVYTTQRNYAAAADRYKNILNAHPERDDIQMKLGNVFLKMRDWKTSIDVLEKAIQMNPENTAAYYNIGNAFQELGEFIKAAEAYRKFLSASPQDLKDTNKRLGECLFKAEQFGEAAQAFQEAVNANPQDITINYSLAQSYQKDKQYEKAAETYYNLAGMSPPKEASIYYNNIVRMFDEANLPEKAAEAAAKVASLKPEDPDAQYNLGFMYVKMKKYSEAIQAFEKAAQLKPNFEYAIMQIGYCYNQLKNYSQSIKAYERLVKSNPDNDNGWLNIAIGYMLQKKWANAIAPLNKTVALKPNSGTAYYNLAICYLNLKDNYSAREVYLKLKKIDPSLAQRLLKYFK